MVSFRMQPTVPNQGRRPLLPALLRPASLLAALALSLCLGLNTAHAADHGTVRVGLLQYGTVTWEMDVLQTHGLAQREGVTVAITPLGSMNALNVALQGGAVDLIVSDWIWVARQRAAERPYTFFPYSLAVGALMTRPDSGISSLADLDGRRLGVAGGPVGKSWLLMRAYSRKMLGRDLADIAEPNFAAPPLLNELMLRGDLPAVINFWHYGARLSAAGMNSLIAIDEVLPALGIEAPIPMLGWTFDENWGLENPDRVNGFLRASFAAKAILANSDQEWERIRPLTKAADDTVLKALRDSYRKGIPRVFGAREEAAAEAAFRVLAELGGEALVGNATSLDAGTFWSGYTLEP